MKKDIRPRPNIKFQLVSPESDHEESSHIHDKAYGKCIFTRLSLRIQLLNDRFTIKEIDDILEEIQEEVLPYDNYSSILSKIQLQQHKLSNQDLDSKTESTQDSSSFSQLTGFSPPETSSVSLTQKGIEKDEDISSSSDEMDNAFEYFEPVDRSQAYPRIEPQLCTFPELHLVAKQENLEVATYILCSWINEDAEKNDLYQLFSSVLPTLLRRYIIEIQEQNKLDDIILPALENLTSSLLRKAGVSPESIPPIPRCVGYIVRLSRQIFFNFDAMDHNSVCRISDLISSLLFNTINDLNEVRNNVKPINFDDETALLASLWKEGKVSSCIPNGDESNQDNLKATNDFAMNSIDKLAESNAMKETESLSTEKDQILSYLFGSSRLEHRKSNLEEYESCNLRLAHSKTTNVKVVAELKNNIQAYQSERNILHDRMEALRAALKQLEADDLELEEKINASKDQITDLESISKENLSNCIEDVRAAENTQIVDNTISLLGHEIKFCKEFMAKAVSTSKASTATKSIQKDTPRGFDLFLVHVHNSVKSQLTCVNALRERVRVKTKRVRKMESEINQYKSLGLVATVSHLSETIKMVDKNIHQDLSLIDRRVFEAQRCYEIFDVALRQFISKHNLSTLQDALVRKILVSVTSIGLTCSDDFKSFSRTKAILLPSEVTMKQCTETHSLDSDQESTYGDNT